jgi:hypothetical protein
MPAWSKREVMNVLQTHDMFGKDAVSES